MEKHLFTIIGILCIAFWSLEMIGTFLQAQKKRYTALYSQLNDLLYSITKLSVHTNYDSLIRNSELCTRSLSIMLASCLG
jgi:hypothetical protein